MKRSLSLATLALVSALAAPVLAWDLLRPRDTSLPATLEGWSQGTNAFECVKRNYPNIRQTNKPNRIRYYSTGQFSWIVTNQGSPGNSGYCQNNGTPRG